MLLPQARRSKAPVVLGGGGWGGVSGMAEPPTSPLDRDTPYPLQLLGICPNSQGAIASAASPMAPVHADHGLLPLSLLPHGVAGTCRPLVGKEWWRLLDSPRSVGRGLSAQIWLKFWTHPPRNEFSLLSGWPGSPASVPPLLKRRYQLLPGGAAVKTPSNLCQQCAGGS